MMIRPGSVFLRSLEVTKARELNDILVFRSGYEVSLRERFDMKAQDRLKLYEGRFR